mmetsp:Transcript_48379/g.113228  ORF Transcript_48379/g.113228 Transcript_48379/m.113228 type:complete len:129 (-) Transcript_48379:8-394(-)
MRLQYVLVSGRRECSLRHLPRHGARLDQAHQAPAASQSPCSKDCNQPPPQRRLHPLKWQTACPVIVTRGEVRNLQQRTNDPVPAEAVVEQTALKGWEASFHADLKAWGCTKAKDAASGVNAKGVMPCK